MPPKKSSLSAGTRKNDRDAFNRSRAETRHLARVPPPLDTDSGPGPDNIPDPPDPENVVNEMVSAETQTDPVQQSSVSIQEKPDEEDKGVQAVQFLPSVSSVGIQQNPQLENKGVQHLELHPVRLCRAVQTEVEMTTNETQTCCNDFQVSTTESICEFLKCSVSPEWTVSMKDSSELRLAMIDNVDGNLLIKRAILFINGDLQITVHGRPLLNNHKLMHIVQSCKEDNEAIGAQHLKQFTEVVEKMKVCSGFQSHSELWTQGVFAKRGAVENVYSPNPVYRSNKCGLLLNKNEKDTCLACRAEMTNMLRESNRRAKAAELDKNRKSRNIRFMPKHELEAALKEARLSDSKHARQIRELRKRIDKLIQNGVRISKGWSETLKNVNKKNFDKMTPIQQLFWDQQLKAASLKRKSSMNWHPMMIRLAISFQKSSNVNKLRQHEVLFLPTNRTLFDYTHHIKAKDGVQELFIQDIKKDVEAKCKESHERYVVLMFNEMHVRANLVYNKATGELVGYAKLDDIETEFKNLQAEWSGLEKPKAPPIAEKVLVFMVKNITTNDRARIVKGVVAVYPVASSMSASSLFTRLWEVIYSVESAGIPIICATCDGASTNRACINMHPKYRPDKLDADEMMMGMYDNNKPVFCTTNMASPDLRPLFFIIDPPHVLKTLRNAYANSVCHKKSRRLWNGEDISWKLVRDYYEKNKGNKFRKSQVSSAHVYLTGFSVMKVLFAAQVMSNKLSSAIDEDLSKDGSSQHKAAVTFMKKTNDLFDCLNGHNVTSGDRFRNENLKPYSSMDDSRFKDVLFDYLDYIEKWKQAALQRPGNFSKKDRKAMQIPDQTSSALRVTVFGMRGAIKYLLGAGAKQVCGRRFCQDPLEQAFSTLRAKGGSNNSLDVGEVLQATVSLHAQGQAAIPSLRGNTSVEKQDIVIDDTPLPKRKKRRLE